MKKYQLITELIGLLEEFEKTQTEVHYSQDLSGFKKWICDEELKTNQTVEDIYWEGKEKGRSAESAINTLIVHMNRYAKSYSKSAIHDSQFSTQEDFIYMINLKAFGPMSKSELIKKNIHEKSVGMQIINRLIKHRWVVQKDSAMDKRSKILMMTAKGEKTLDQNMGKIRQATQIVTGNLTQAEKMQLIKLLQKLEHFHQPIYAENLDPSHLIDSAFLQYSLQNNKN